MKKTILLVFFCTVVEEGLGGHVFVPLEKTWLEAQAYCRENYIDLSNVVSQSDQESLLAAAGENITMGWIGLQIEAINSSVVWKWSGGGLVTYNNWSKGQPDNYCSRETVGQIWRNGRWNDNNSLRKLPFYCINSILILVQKTWEEALEHCRETHTDLASLHLETETTHVLGRMKHNNIIEPVWIGLRFLGDRWLWMHGDPLVYEAWTEGGDQDHQCPMRKRCGALTKAGVRENRDCQEKLNFICK